MDAIGAIVRLTSGLRPERYCFEREYCRQCVGASSHCDGLGALLVWTLSPPNGSGAVLLCSGAIAYPFTLNGCLVK